MASDEKNDQGTFLLFLPLSPSCLVSFIYVLQGLSRRALLCVRDNSIQQRLFLDLICTEHTGVIYFINYRSITISSSTASE